ncbi:MAG: mdtB [Chlamydiales bacterium]|jgi:HAE1 family hydrophobic/amphiphilic exporter-1|nr:mdtB [Chlamydiales bacterium]
MNSLKAPSNHLSINLSKLFILRPVMTFLLMASLTLSGIYSYCLLPISDLPNVDYPMIFVSTSYPGASTETVNLAITKPLEQQLMTIPGVETILSDSFSSLSQIRLRFSLDKDMGVAANEVAQAIDKAPLPRDLTHKPRYRKHNPSAAPILYLSLRSPSASQNELYKIAKHHLSNRFTTIQGVAQVSLWGSQKAFRIYVDPILLAGANLDLEEVLQRIKSHTAEIPLGTIDWGALRIDLKTQIEPVSKANIEEIILEEREGTQLRLKDIARVDEGLEQDPSYVRYFDAHEEQRALILSIEKQPGCNTVDVAQKVKALLKPIQDEIGAEYTVEVMFDRSLLIEQSLHEMKETLGFSCLLVILTIFFYLGRLSDTLVPAIVIPLSLLGTFSAMHALGYSLDNLSLLALTLAIGFVVDDAIVVMENIVRLKEKGESAFSAAMQGSLEIGFTILSMTVSLIAVFIPLFFMQGLMGKFLQEFAVTLAVAVACSGVISLTLTPMLMSRFPFQQKPARFKGMSDGLNEGLLKAYIPLLKWAIGHPKATLTLFFLSIAGTVGLYQLTPAEFMPDDDSGSLIVWMDCDSAQSPYETVEKIKMVNRQLAKNPHLQKAFSLLSGNASGYSFLSLKPAHQRPPIQQIAKALKEEFQGVPGLVLTPIPLASLDLPFKSMGSGGYQYSLRSFALDDLEAGAAKMVQAMSQSPRFQRVSSDLGKKKLQINAVIDKNIAALHEVTPEKIQNALRIAFSESQVALLEELENQYPLLLRVETSRNTPLSTLFLRNKRQALVPLSNLVDMEERLTQESIHHEDQVPAITLSFHLGEGVSLEAAMEEIEGLKGEILPAHIKGRPQGAAQGFALFLESILVSLLLSAFIMYIVLGMLYENLIHPLTILASLPVAALGALLTLYLMNKPLSFYAFIGLLLLLGIVKKNGIMIIDQTLTLKEQGLSPELSVYQACLIRFRPIMMTTFAAVFGALPIALGLGAQASARQGLGLAIIGGLLFSQLFTLLFTPVLYLSFEKMGSLGRKTAISPS